MFSWRELPEQLRTGGIQFTDFCLAGAPITRYPELRSTLEQHQQVLMETMVPMVAMEEMVLMAS
jgi:hypothetical protein